MSKLSTITVFEILENFVHDRDELLQDMGDSWEFASEFKQLTSPIVALLGWLERDLRSTTLPSKNKAVEDLNQIVERLDFS